MAEDNEVEQSEVQQSLSPEEVEKRRTDALKWKDEGNQLFKEKNYEDASAKYSEALDTCPEECKADRAILFANRAACKMKQELNTEAIEDCSQAIELNPDYLKAIQRRATLYEGENKLDEALDDFKRILVLDPSNNEARAASVRLPPQINERNEKLKTEMLGSLKELGNKLLRPFGLSTDNFQVQQDPNSGGYSINFSQNQK